MITHVLDTSALLAHFRNEPGADQVTDLLALGPNMVAVSAVTLVELKGRLQELVSDSAEVERVFNGYINILTLTLPLNKEIALAAIELREKLKSRLPLADALIAATAKANNAILVHRDPHLAAIPSAMLNQIVLPPKA